MRKTIYECNICNRDSEECRDDHTMLIGIIDSQSGFKEEKDFEEADYHLCIECLNQCREFIAELDKGTYGK